MKSLEFLNPSTWYFLFGVIYQLEARSYCSMELEVHLLFNLFSEFNVFSSQYPIFFPNGKYILFLGYTSIHVFSTILQHAGYVHSCLKFSFLGFRRLHMIMKEIPIHFSLCSLSKFKCRFLDSLNSECLRVVSRKTRTWKVSSRTSHTYVSWMWV